MPQPDPAVYRDPATPPQRDRWNPRAVRAFTLSLLSVLLVPALLGLTGALYDPLGLGHAFVLVGVTVAASSIACFVLGVRSARMGAATRREVPAHPVPERGRGLATAAIVLGALGALMQVLGFAAACLAIPMLGRGRQIRRGGRAVLPPVVPGRAWTTLALDLRVDPAAREALAARWRENGRTEHASVAAFARLALDLVAVGAPPALLAGTQRDALDEIRHADLCFSIARALDGRCEGPGPFPEAARARSPARLRVVALAELAVDSLLDGALNEGVAARVAVALAARCEDPGIRAALREIAADEGRHAAHGWDVVAWCVAEGGEPVGRALLGALAAWSVGGRAGHAGHADHATEADEGAWERWGVPGRALEARERARTLEDLGPRVRRLVARGASGLRAA